MPSNELAVLGSSLCGASGREAQVKVLQKGAKIHPCHELGCGLRELEAAALCAHHQRVVTQASFPRLDAVSTRLRLPRPGR